VGYTLAVIRNFRNRLTQQVFDREPVRGLSIELQRAARRKLLLIQHAGRLDDLKVPPGNRLEMLKGDRKGQFSIRVNDQWRICFRWSGNDAHDVELVDYHG